jgi:hypothetical protein
MSQPLPAAEFARLWGAESLVRLPAGVALPPGAAGDFLTQAGLPALVSCFEDESESKITFCRLAAGLATLAGEPSVGPPTPIDRAAFYVLGDEFFCNGSAWWCLHREHGYVARIDIGLREPVALVNTGVAELASSLFAAVCWSEHCTRTETDWVKEVDRLQQILKLIDAAAFGYTNNFWQAYLLYIAGENPARSGFVKRSLQEGQQALAAGPW